MHYSRPSLTIDQQLQLLIDYKLHVEDEECAKRYLANIGFTRLLPYRVPFFAEDKNYKPGATFQGFVDLYLFDRRLRFHCMEAIDRIEISIRTVISNILSLKYGPFWYMYPDVFKDGFATRENGHKKLIKDIEWLTGKNDPDRRDPACADYYDKFKSPALPPCWIVTDVLPMGAWSIIYSNIRKTKLKKLISKHYDFEDDDVFASIIHSLTITRNICAHHARLWNRRLPPKVKGVDKFVHAGIEVNSTYCQLAVIYAMLRSFTRKSEWHGRLFNLVEKCPLCINTHMGFPKEWFTLPFWNLS